MLDFVYEYDPRREEIKKIDKAITIISILMLAIIPLIMYRHDSVSFSSIFTGSLYATGNKVDVFNYFKTITLNLGAMILLALLVYKIVKLEYQIKSSKLNIALAIFAIAIVLSPLSSKYTDVALFGNFDRHEGAFTWLSYLTIFFVLYNTEIEKKNLKYFFIALLPLIAINLTLSILTLYGINPIEIEFVNNMLGGELNGMLSTTLYHPNFASGVSAVVFSVCFMYLLLEENIKAKIALLITTVLSFAMLLAMTSSGGFVTVLIVVPFILVIAIRFTQIKNVLVWGGATFVLNAVVYFVLSNANEKVYGESFEIIAKLNDISPILIPIAIIGFVGVVAILKFVNRKKVFDIVMIVAIVSTLASTVILSNTIEKEKEVLANDPNASIVRIRDNSLYEKINAMSTDRINIWMKTIDLINEKPLLGNGFDTFPYIIMEEDEDRGISTYGEYIDKPHNWYLTVAYGTGIVGFVGFMGILISIIRKLFFSISDKINNKYIYVFGIGFVAYAVQGLSNDSMVGTSILFWIFAALSANMLLVKSSK